MLLDLLLLLGKDFLVFLPRAHPLQIPSLFGETSGIPVTIFYNPGRACSEGVQTFNAKVHRDQLSDVPKHEWKLLKHYRGLPLEPQSVLLSLALCAYRGVQFLFI